MLYQFLVPIPTRSASSELAVERLGSSRLGQNGRPFHLIASSRGSRVPTFERWGSDGLEAQPYHQVAKVTGRQLACASSISTI